MIEIVVAVHLFCSGQTPYDWLYWSFFGQLYQVWYPQLLSPLWSPKNIKFHVLFILLGHAPINLKVGKRTAKLCLMNAWGWLHNLLFKTWCIQGIEKTAWWYFSLFCPKVLLMLNSKEPPSNITIQTYNIRMLQQTMICH